MIETKENNWLKIQLLKLKPIYHTMVFEFYLQKLKFILFSIISILLGLILFLFPYLSGYPILPETQVDFLHLYFLSYFILFVVVSFFSGIICSDFKKKTGFITFPLINRQYIIIGKFITNFFLVVVVIGILYLSIALITIHFYGTILYTLYYTFNFAILFALALSGFTTFISSFSPSSLSVSITTILIILFGFPLLYQFLKIYEPLWALPYLSNIIPELIYPDFLNRERFYTRTDGLIVYTDYYFPTVEGAITSLVLYFLFSFILALFIFMGREKISFIRLSNIEDALIKKIKGLFQRKRN